MDSENTRPICMAITRAGEPCKNSSLPGSRFCRVHQPANGSVEADVETAAVLIAAAGDDTIIHDDAPAIPEPAAVDDAIVYDERVVAVASEAPAAASAGDQAAGPGASAGELPDDELRGRLADELDHLIHRVQNTATGYAPPPFSPQRLLQMLGENLEKISPDMGLTILQKLRTTLTEDVFNIETWKGIWFLLNYTIELQAGWLKRRVTGEYQTDEWGLDWEFVEAVRPFFEFMYSVYWRVQTTGLENVPETGRGLLVANHSGQLPWDGSMVGTAIFKDHPAHRLVRTLYATWFPTLPFFSAMFVKMGQALATVDNGTRLLQQDELVAVYPEGYKGVGKLYRDRYRLARFGRGGFVKMALRTRAPIIPVAVVGAEETYISLAKSPTMARVTHFPYFPISLTFPWLGLLGFVPLPTKWYIDIGEPISLDAYSPEDADNLVLVSQLTDQVRNQVQQMIYGRLKERRSIFFG